MQILIQGPDPGVCFHNQQGKNNPASPGGHVPKASVQVFFFKQIRNPLEREARCFEIGATSGLSQ